jgi:anti-sigma factor (TIGR02949 family)
MNCALALRMLDAHMDNELDSATAAEIAEHIAACPACTAAHDRRAAVRTAMRTSALREAAPPALRDAIRRRLVRDPARRGGAGGSASSMPVLSLRWWQAIGLAASIAVVGAVGGWWIAPSQIPEALPEYAVARHVASLSPDGPRIDVASSDRHAVRPWFQGRLDFAPTVRDLATQGFDMIGGRVDRVGERQAAAIVYRLRGHVITVFSWRAVPGHRAIAPDVATVRGFNVVSWIDGDLGYSAVSDTDSAELRRFADAFRTP